MFDWGTTSSTSNTNPYYNSTCNYNYYMFYTANHIKCDSSNVRVKEPEPPKEVFFDPKNLW